MDLSADSTKPLDSDIPTMFRPPVNRAMRVLDRSFFKKTVPLSAATIFKNSDISRVRGELQKSRDLLNLPRLSSIREVKTEDAVRKCLLLREGVKYDGRFCSACVLLDIIDHGRRYDLVADDQ